MSLTYARHDVFISAEKQVTLSALAHVGTWLESAGMSTALDAVVSTSAGGESALETRLGVDLRGNGSHGSGAGGVAAARRRLDGGDDDNNDDVYYDGDCNGDEGESAPADARSPPPL